MQQVPVIATEPTATQLPGKTQVATVVASVMPEAIPEIVTAVSAR